MILMPIHDLFILQLWPVNYACRDVQYEPFMSSEIVRNLLILPREIALGKDFTIHIVWKQY